MFTSQSIIQNNSVPSASRGSFNGFTMSISGEIVSQTLTSSLVQVPMIAADYHLKAPPNASEALRMKANADMLAQMTFNDQLVRDLQMYVGHLSRLGRSL